MNVRYMVVDEWTGGTVNVFTTLAAAQAERDRLNRVEPGRYYIPDAVPAVTP